MATKKQKKSSPICYKVVRRLVEKGNAILGIDIVLQQLR